MGNDRNVQKFIFTVPLRLYEEINDGSQAHFFHYIYFFIYFFYSICLNKNFIARSFFFFPFRINMISFILFWDQFFSFLNLKYGNTQDMNINWKTSLIFFHSNKRGRELRISIGSGMNVNFY